MTTEDKITLKEFMLLLIENLEEKISIQYITQEKAVRLAKEEVEKANVILQDKVNKVEKIAEASKGDLTVLKTKALIWGVLLAFFVVLATNLITYFIFK